VEPHFKNIAAQRNHDQRGKTLGDILNGHITVDDF
jgi:hypothetical protein